MSGFPLSPCHVSSVPFSVPFSRGKGNRPSKARVDLGTRTPWPLLPPAHSATQPGGFCSASLKQKNQLTSALGARLGTLGAAPRERSEARAANGQRLQAPPCHHSKSPLSQTSRSRKLCKKGTMGSKKAPCRIRSGPKRDPILGTAGARHPPE